MEEITKILAEIENDKDCSTSRLASPIEDMPFELPKDLEYYLENYASMVLFNHAEYSIKIVGLSEFKRANPGIAGEDVEDDRSHDWYLIADDGNSQYITIDLAKDRLGNCYDSFWDRHGVSGEQAVIAKSFTELIERLYNAKGKSWYWTEPYFQSYGDAYDD